MIDPTILPDMSTIAAPLYAVFIMLEIGVVGMLARAGKFETRDTITSIAMGTGSAVFGILFGGLGFFALMWISQFALFDIPTTVLSLIIIFIVDDFRYYWSHRFSHTIRWFWANHVVHHSSQHFNLSTALRQPWFSNLSGLFILNVPLVLIGVHPGALAFVYSLNLLYQFFIHTEAIGRLPGPIEAVMNTPSHHRVHHSTHAAHLDMNYAGVFIVWDRLFKTFVDEDHALAILPDNQNGPKMKYGIVHNIATFNPFRVAVHEYVSILLDITKREVSWRQKLAYIVAPPGWSHDGSRQTSSMIKKQYRASHVNKPSESHYD